MSEARKLNLGPGKCLLAGYDNRDIKDGLEAYPLADIEDGTYDEVRASHLLEHFRRALAVPVIREWARVLKPGGRLFLAVPDFGVIARRYIEGAPVDAQGHVMGGQVDEHDYHKAIFDEAALRKAMTEAGLTDIERWTGEADSSQFETSLNLVGVRRAGPLTPYDWLGRHVRSRYSQHGEDGIIAAILDKLPEDVLTKFAVEVGCSDGVFMSNTRALVEERGYKAVWIDADETAARAAHQSAVDGGIADRVEVRLADASPENVTEMLQALPLPDVLSLDIDGGEYQIWQSLPNEIKPPVVIVEFDPTRKDARAPSRSDTWQAGLNALEKLVWAMYYRPVCQIGCNLISIRADLSKHILDPLWVGPEPEAPTDAHEIGKAVRACMTLPRIGFTDNLFCCIAGLAPCGIQLIRSSGVFWGQCLTELIERTIAEGYEYILTIDYDTVFDERDVRELYRLMQAHPEADAISSVQMKRSSVYPLFSMRSKGGEKLLTIPLEALDAELMQIGTSHFGLTMFRAAAFADVERPWFHAIPDEYGSWHGGRHDNNAAMWARCKAAGSGLYKAIRAAAFTVIGWQTDDEEDGDLLEECPQTDTGGYSRGSGKQDEDIAFWHRWHAAGKTLYQANKVTIGHIQSMVTWPGLDMLPVYQHIQEYNEHGKPTDGIR
jgi:predicted SAM-dependent methyltransferase